MGCWEPSFRISVRAQVRNRPQKRTKNAGEQWTKTSAAGEKSKTKPIHLPPTNEPALTQLSPLVTLKLGLSRSQFRHAEADQESRLWAHRTPPPRGQRPRYGQRKGNRGRLFDPASAARQGSAEAHQEQSHTVRRRNERRIPTGPQSPNHQRP